MYDMESEGKILIIDPGETAELMHWIPYQKLGLTLVNESYPPVGNKVLISGNYKFSEGMERRFDVEACGTYRLELKVKSGRIELYMGASPFGIELNGEYSSLIDWGSAPYLRIEGKVSGSEVEIRCEKEVKA